ncbi:MAG: hypothetical protein J2P41_10005 [Blastocatellia bacterium]|nr:hypothetical protein [Blastocatellia bacterium]
MWLKDYNGDGKALEFALFAKGSCLGVDTTLIGYSERQDRVIQYPISLKMKGPDESTILKGYWYPSLFLKEPISPGHWKYEIDFRGREGSLNKYEIRYDAQKEMFVGVVETPGEGN